MRILSLQPLLFFMCTVLFLWPISTVFAQGVLPFGGKILKIQACKTPPGLMLTIGPPVAGQYLLSPLTVVFSYGAFIPGTWVLGNAANTAVACVGSPASLGGFSVGGLGGGGLPGIGSLFSSLGVSFGKNPPVIGHPRPIIIIGTGSGPSL